MPSVSDHPNMSLYSLIAAHSSPWTSAVTVHTSHQLNNSLTGRYLELQLNTALIRKLGRPKKQYTRKYIVLVSPFCSSLLQFYRQFNCPEGWSQLGGGGGGGLNAEDDFCLLLLCLLPFAIVPSSFITVYCTRIYFLLAHHQSFCSTVHSCSYSTYQPTPHPIRLTSWRVYRKLFRRELRQVRSCLSLVFNIFNRAITYYVRCAEFHYLIISRMSIKFIAGQKIGKVLTGR